MGKETDKRLIIEALAKRGLMLTVDKSGVRCINYISNIPAFKSEHNIDFEIPSVSNECNVRYILSRYDVVDAVEMFTENKVYYADVVLIDDFFITLPLREELSIEVYKKIKRLQT